MMQPLWPGATGAVIPNNQQHAQAYHCVMLLRDTLRTHCSAAETPVVTSCACLPICKNLECCLRQNIHCLQVRNVLLTVALFCGPLLITFSFLNTVAIAYHSTAALPFGTICVILVIWALITFPLTVVGGIAGKNRQVSLASSI